MAAETPLTSDQYEQLFGRDPNKVPLAPEKDRYGLPTEFFALEGSDEYFALWQVLKQANNQTSQIK